MKVFSKIILIVILAIIVFIANTVWLSFEYRDTLRELHMDNLKNHVMPAYNILENYYKKTQEGELSEEEAKIQAQEHIRIMRYHDGQGYFWINDTGAPYPKMIMHPTVPALNGTVVDDPKWENAVWDSTNSGETHLFQAFIEVCNAEGEGYVEYMWPKPIDGGLTEDQPKLSFVKQFDPWGWIVGTGYYIDNVEEQYYSAIFFLSLSALIIALIILFVGMLISRSITKELKEINDKLSKVAEGDLTVRIELYSNNEFGKLARIINQVMLSNLSYMTERIKNAADHVSSSVNEFSKASGKLADLATNISDQSNSISEAAKITYDSMGKINTVSQGLLDNIDSVASSANEISSSLTEISTSTSQTAMVASKALDRAKLSTNEVNDLRERAQEIGEVVDIINKIADQTNLLALNATIEAAGAGDAGRSFAVVANEVKELSKQTADATKQIENKILAIRDSANNSILAIQEITNIVGEVDTFANSVASAVEQQSITMHSISETLNEINNGTQSLNTDVKVVGDQTKTILNKIVDMSEVADSTAAIATETEASAKNLLNLSQALLNATQRFKISGSTQESIGIQVVEEQEDPEISINHSMDE